MQFYMGVDPGMSGGCAVLNEDGKIYTVFKFKGLTLHDLAAEFVIIRRAIRPKAVLEKVHAMPGQGVSSTFKFGQNFGQLEMCLVGLKIPYDLVTPQKWMKRLGCMTRGDKNVSKARAQQLWPDQKITHAIADAMLMAEYCRVVDRGI